MSYFALNKKPTAGRTKINWISNLCRPSIMEHNRFLDCNNQNFYTAIT